MTSKAAFILLVNSYLGDNYSHKEVDKNYAEIVNKLMGDLNVLEIIKELFTVEMIDNMIKNIEDLSTSVTLKDGTYTFQTPENQTKIAKLKIVKEWLNGI